MIFLFSENMILFFRRKMKDDLCQKKIHGNVIYSSNVPNRWSFQKNCTGIWFFLYHEGRWHFFFPKIWFFLRTENEKWYFSKNNWKYDVFCMLLKLVFLFPTNMKWPFCQNSKDDPFPKNTPKDDISCITEKNDIHHRKNDIGILCPFMETFLSVFKYCFPTIIKKKTGNLIYRVEIWLYL